MFAKLEITGIMEVVTGLHIGANGAFAAIGAVDSPVIRDAMTNEPIIPGSSMKGKLRTLLAKKYNEQVASSPDNDAECIKGLFGSAHGTNGNAMPGRLIFSDMFLLNKEDFAKRDIRATEVKFENSISRTTAVANPRQIERVVRGAKFGLNLIYESDNEAKLLDDVALLADGLKLLQYDYLGGSGSRGYGKVHFSELNADVVIGEISEDTLDKCNALLNDI